MIDLNRSLAELVRAGEITVEERVLEFHESEESGTHVIAKQRSKDVRRKDELYLSLLLPS